MTGTRMSDDKKTEDQPTFVVATPMQPSLKSRLTKKHVLIAVVSLLITGLVVTAVLVGIRIYTDNELEEMKLQYSMSMKDKNNNDVQQNVSSDSNSVLYEVANNNGKKTWILQDFDKGIEVTKVQSDSGVTCYLTTLNRSAALEPNKVPKTAPDTNEKTPNTQLVYEVDTTQVSDITFLGSRAKNLCNNVPTHWMMPSCAKGGSNSSLSTNNGTSQGRSKRATFCAYYYSGGVYYPCVCGCCWLLCAATIYTDYTYYYSSVLGWVCQFTVVNEVARYDLHSNGCYSPCFGGAHYCYYPWS